MPSSFGLWFSAYAETLIDDLLLLDAAFKTADQSPLGSAAGFGSSFPIDRNFTKDELNFKHLKVNSLASQISRGKIEKSISFFLSSFGSTISKFCMDICLYMGQDFSFISFPDNLTTGSSIMPHKKNPDLFEIIRAKGMKLQNVNIEISLISSSLPSGYHRDFQLNKGKIINAVKLLIIKREGYPIESKTLKMLKTNKVIFEISSLNIPKTTSTNANRNAIRNTDRQKYQNSLLHAVSLKLFQLVKTDTHASFMLIIFLIIVK